jgi:hypothetical protein
MADSVGINYSMIQPSGAGSVNKGAWEVLGSKDLNDAVAITAKGVLKNAHSTPGYGVALEVGTKIKLSDLKGSVIPWVQPALTYTSPESGGGNYLGYVVDGGVDLKYGAFTVTPAVSYANDFSTRQVRQETAGVKVAYAVTKNISVDARYRREFNEVGADANRIYGGVSYNF